MAFIQALEETPRGAVAGSRYTAGSCQIADRVRGIELCALKGRWQESRSPIVHAVLGLSARIRNGHIGGQALIVAAQRIRHPSAHAGKAIERIAGGHVVLAGAMRVGLPLHRVDEAHLIN